MRAYVLYKDKTVKSFKKLINAEGSIFDKYRVFAIHFLKYAQNELDRNLAEYDSILDFNTLDLESVFPKKYKWLISNIALKNHRSYLKNLESRITEFENKEDNLKLLVGIQFLRFLIVTKIVETYLSASCELKKSGADVSKLTLSDIGINKRIMKWLDIFQEFDNKTVDDWLNLTVDYATASYFYSSMKRILSILTSADSV